MIRAFLAFNIPEEIKKNLNQFITPFQSQQKGVRWIRLQNYHVTLKFFDSIDETTMLEPLSKIIEEQLAAFKPVELTCEGLGCFPIWARPKVIWADLKGERASLIHLQKNLEESFSKLGFPREERAFKVHLTLARIRSLPKERGWLKSLEALPPQTFGKFIVDRLTFYKSVLTKEGPVYTSLKEFPFKN